VKPVLFLLLCVTSPVLCGQSGVVKSANQPIPGATIMVTQGNQKFVTTTDSAGHYVLPHLAEGIWAVTVEMFGFEPAKKQVDYAKTKLVDFNLQLRESPVAGRMAQFAARANGQAGSQLDAQIQSELNSNQAQPLTPSGGTQNSNEAFLISGSLSQGLSPNASSDFGPNQQSQFGGARDPFSGQTPNAPGFGGGGNPGGGFGGRRGPGGGPGGRGGGPERRGTPRVISNAQVTFNRNRSETTPFFANGANIHTGRVRSVPIRQSGD